MFEPEELLDSIYDLEHGTPKLKALASAIEEADKNSADYWRLYFRHEYIQESIFHGDNFKAIIQFPEYLKLFDEHPEFEDDMSHEMMWTFKNVLENMKDYYQISRKEIEHYFEEFKKRSQKYGESLRVYYMKKCRLYLHMDKQLAKDAYEKFQKFPRTANSDCLACEMNFDMECALEFGNEEQALHIAKPILEGERRCAEIPHDTYAELAKYYLYHGNLDEALYYATRCERLITGEPEFLEQTGFLLEVYSVIDASHGWKVLKYALADFVDCKNPVMRLGFARGAYRLLKAVAEQTEFLLNSGLQALPVPKTEEGWETKAVCDYFYQIAKDLSEKFDTRNQSRYYQDLLETELEKLDNVPADTEKTVQKPAHGIVKKENTILMTALPEQLEPTKVIAERIQKAKETDFEILVCDPEEKNIYFSVRYDDKIHEFYLIFQPQELTHFYAKPLYGMSEEVFASIMDSQYQCLLVAELTGHAQDAYHVYMQVLSIAFPNMLGVINAFSQKAYPPNWVRFAGQFQHAVTPADIYGLDITGSEDGSDIFMTTVGLCTLGLRELELVGANKDNFGYFADMLSYVAYQCVANDMLPDENEVIAVCYEEQEEYAISWNMTEKILDTLPDDCLAVRVERNCPSGVLILEQTGESPAINSVFENPENLHFPSVRDDFYRKIELAKETFPVFENALSQKIERGAVRLEVELDEEQEDEFDYSIELVWAELQQDEDNSVKAYLAEEYESLPAYHIDDEIAFTQDTIASWVIQPAGSEDTISQEEAYLLL